MDQACRPLIASGATDVLDTEQFFLKWVELADHVSSLADSDAASGRAFSASDRYRRAAVYYLTAERMQKHGFLPRDAAYASGLE